MDVEHHLPLRAADHFILLALAEADRHGYGLLRDVERLSQGHVSLETGGLYRRLRRLLELRWVERTDALEVAGEDERRRYYRLTDLGRQVAVAELRRLHGVVQTTAKLGLLEGRS